MKRKELVEGTAVYVVVEETYRVKVPGRLDGIAEKATVLKGFVEGQNKDPRICVESAGELVYRFPKEIYKTLEEAVAVAEEKAQALDKRKHCRTSRDFRPFGEGPNILKYEWAQDSSRFPEYRKYCWWLDRDQEREVDRHD